MFLKQILIKFNLNKIIQFQISLLFISEIINTRVVNKIYKNIFGQLSYTKVRKRPSVG